MHRDRSTGWLLVAIAVIVAVAAPLGTPSVLVAALGIFVAGMLALAIPREGQSPISGTTERADSAADTVALLLDAIDDPMLLVRGGEIVRANAPARALFGAHVVDEDVRLTFRQPAAVECLTRARPGSPCRVLLDAVGSEARQYEMQVSHAGEDTRVVRLFDRASAAVVEKVRTDFVANASHELRTPLSTLIGFIETLEDRNAAEDAATRGRFLKIMMGEARRMQQLVDDLISLSRIEGERFSAPATPVFLPAVAEEVKNAITSAQRLAEGRILLTVSAEQATVAGDRGQLAQLLHNLIGNALKYGRSGTSVRVGLAELDGRRLLLTIADEGEGIAAEHLPRITERFYRVDPGRSRALGGTGLGLAIVKHIVERHRGRLQIDSRPGIGTTVAVTLPLVATEDRS